MAVGLKKVGPCDMVQMDFPGCCLSRSAQLCEPGVGLIQQGTHRTVPVLHMAPGALPGLVLQSCSHFCIMLHIPEHSYLPSLRSILAT